MRSNMDAAEYKHVVLGLIFLKYISDSFIELHEKLKKDKLSDPEDMDEYVSRTIFWVPKEARWDYLQDNAKKPEIEKILDEAMDAIERDNGSLKGVLPKNYGRPGLNKQKKATKTVLEQAELMAKSFPDTTTMQTHRKS